MAIYFLIFLTTFSWTQTGQPPLKGVEAARELILERRYKDAITKLEEALETSPNHAEALSLLGAAYLYGDGDFIKAKKTFDASSRAGGGATFWVNHSHEKLGTSEPSDYCRGWFYVGKEGIEFAPEHGQHGFRLSYLGLKELKQNRLFKSQFHVNDGQKTFNFRPRTGDEGEVWLVVAMFKNLSKQN
jgi:tetratricopeptide (TPR) repeat protein